MILGEGNTLPAGTCRLLLDATINIAEGQAQLRRSCWTDGDANTKRLLAEHSQWATRIGLSETVSMSRVAPPNICSLRRV